MKKFFPIIFGTLVGITLSVGLIHNTSSVEAEDILTPQGNFFEWNDVFSPSNKGKNLYELVYYKRLEAPEEDTLKNVAQKFGLTTEEAKKVIAGSITPLLQNPDQRSADLSEEDALILMKNMQEDYEILLEIFELQQEIDVAINPSEIFANNDLSDSGFDLIHDLEIIEEILFIDIIPNTVGAPFGNQLNSPADPIVEEYDPNSTIPYDPSGPLSAVGITITKNPFEDSGEEGAEESGAATIALGEDEEDLLDVEILPEDVCELDNGLLDALKEYEKDKAAADVEADLAAIVGPGGEDDDGAGGNGAGGNGFGGDNNEDQSGGLNEEGELEPAPADSWLKSWCPALTGEGESSSGNTFGETGFSSLGGTVNSVLNQAAGAAVGIDEGGFAAHIGICFETELVKETVSSYDPGDSCILCEIEKINENMDKTLSKSLVPNKTTGNLLETAKCKDSYQASIDMQFITIAAPVQTPQSDDVILGKNLFEEWKRFVDDFKPLFPDFLTEVGEVQKFDASVAKPETNTLELLNQFNSQKASSFAEAKAKLDNIKAAEDATNVKLYSQTILSELRQVNALFKGYDKIYNDIIETASEICKKGEVS